MALVAAQTAAAALPQMVVTPTTFVFIGERLWLDFVNTDDLRRGVRVDVLRDFDALIQWLGSAGVLDSERASGIGRRADQQRANPFDQREQHQPNGWRPDYAHCHGS